MTEFAELNGMLSGRYRIEREIGRGGMAVVYLARDLRHDRLVALKVMSAGLGALLGAERFLAEIRVTANLQHPNILPLFDSGEAGDSLFYVMPYVEGESLRGRLRRERTLPVEDAVHIASLTAAALDYAHRQGVVHRDLKPENILLRDGEPLIADFGIALAVSRSADQGRLTQSGLSLGTPQYMSPEQATGDSAVDGRSDLFSLGAVLYEMLVGEPPHSGPTVQAIVARVIGEVPRGIRTVRPATPEYVEHAVVLALEKMPADRLQSGRAFVEALSGHLPVARTAQKSTSSATRTRVWRALPWGIALAGVGLAAVAPRTEVEPTTMRFELPLPRDLLAAEVSGSVAVAPSGELFAFILRDSGTTTPRVYVRQLADTQLRRLEGTEGASQLFFSPDGQWIGFYTTPHLKKVRVDGGAPQVIGEVPRMFGGSWTRDGKIVVSSNGRLAIIDDAGGSVQPFSMPDSSANELLQRWPLVLPDGKTIAYTARGRIAEEQRIALALFDGSSRILDDTGSAPLALIGDRLIYRSCRSPAVDRNGIMAVVVDVRARRASGKPVELEHGVAGRVDGSAAMAISESGMLVYRTEPEPQSQLVRYSADSGARVLVKTQRHYLHPRLSPDGKHLAVTIDPPGSAPNQIVLLDLLAGTEARVTTDSVSGYFPEWSADGRHVLFTFGSKLWRRAADLSAPPEPFPGMSGGVDYALSRDGRKAVIRVNLPTYDRDLTYRELTRDTAMRPLVVGPGNPFAPRLSPDGSLVAYFAEDAGATEVFVTPVPGPGPQYQVSSGGGFGPVWAADGRHLYYQQADKLIVATVATSPRLEVVRREAVAGISLDRNAGYHANFDVTPNGDDIVYPQRTDTPPTWIVAPGWAQSVRSRMRPVAKR